MRLVKQRQRIANPNFDKYGFVVIDKDSELHIGQIDTFIAGVGR